MKVGLFFGTFAGGGAERMMVNLASGLSEKGINVTIYVVNKLGTYLNEVPDNIKIHSYDAKYGVKSVIHKIRNTLKNDGLEALISTQEHINAAVGLASFRLNSSTKIIFREANTPTVKKHSRVRKTLYSRLYPLADHFVAVSKGVEKAMEEYYNIPSKKIDVIYNPVVNEQLINQSKEEISHEWFMNEQVPVIVGMGRFKPQKNFEDLIKAFSFLRSQIEAKLIIFGDRKEESPYFKKIAKLVADSDLKDDVAFPGFVDNPFKYLSQASLFVLSSKYEGLPGVLIQAMACGCPVVSTDCPSGPREILKDGEYGPLVEVGDIEGMAEAMYKSLKSTDDIQSVKERGRFFSVENAADQYFKLIKGERL